MVIVDLRGGSCRFLTRPKSHSAAVCTVKHLAFRAGRRLALRCDSICGCPHELRKSMHIPYPSKITSASACCSVCVMLKAI